MVWRDGFLGCMTHYHTSWYIMSLFNIFNHPRYLLLLFSLFYVAMQQQLLMMTFIDSLVIWPENLELKRSYYVCNNLPYKADVYIHTFNHINSPAGQSRMFRIPCTRCAGCRQDIISKHDYNDSLKGCLPPNCLVSAFVCAWPQTCWQINLVIDLVQLHLISSAPP